VTGNTIPQVDFSVLQPNGNSVASLFVGAATGFRNAFTLPVTGTYSVTINPREQFVGTATFTLNEVAPP
jgi:hypothetical protein